MKNRVLYILALLFVVLQTFAQTYTYDSNNRLTKVVYDNGTTITYTFDALGNRTSKKVTGSAATKYTISVAVTPSGSGSVTGGGSYSSGVSVELNAIANAGYQFLKWNDGVTTNPRTITVTGNQTYTAQFEEEETGGIAGDITGDGKVNAQDLNALVNAYLANTQATEMTDLDKDSRLTIADITSLISMIYTSSCDYDNNGHRFVDLGLPSGTLWATCNVGASTPEAAGDHFAWGETETKDDYTWATYKWCDGDECNNSNKTLTKYCLRAGYGKPDGKVNLELDDDVAHVKWGGDWHMPTTEQFQELMDNCSYERIEMSDGRDGYQFVGPNGNSIILPYAGYWNGTTYKSTQFYYWSSDQKLSDNPVNNHGTHGAALRSGVELVGLYRYRGYAVRPVLSEYTPNVQSLEVPTTYLGHDLVNLGLPSGTLWATCNLGASSPESYGCYYSWAETTGSCDGKSNFSEDTYQYFNGTSMTNYLEDGTLSSSDDAATQQWGGKWRIPTKTEIKELANSDYTTLKWTTKNGIYGIHVTSIVEGYQGNSIFLPAAGQYRSNQLKDNGEQGFYWGSSIHEITTGDYPYPSGDCLRLGEEYLSTGAAPRWRGHSVRPVVSVDDVMK